MTQKEYERLAVRMSMYCDCVIAQYWAHYCQSPEGPQSDVIRHMRPIMIPSWILAEVGPHYYWRIAWFCMRPGADRNEPAMQCIPIRADRRPSDPEEWPTLVKCVSSLSIPDFEYVITFPSSDSWLAMPVEEACAEMRDRFVAACDEQLPTILTILDLEGDTL